MSLTDQAVQAICSYRQNVLEEPTQIDQEINKLLENLRRIGIDDNNMFYQVNKQSFVNFPEDEKFDKETYMTFRYLYETSFVVRRILIQQKTNLLEEKATKLIDEYDDLTRGYDKEYGQLSPESIGKRAVLKTQSKWNGLKKSKTLYVIKKVIENPNSYKQENSDEWKLPGEYKEKMKEEFQNSSREIGEKLGLSKKLIDFYIKHIDRKKFTERAAIVSGVIGGTVLIAWGLSNRFKSGDSLDASSDVFYTNSLAGNIPIDTNPAFINYGIENYPEYMATQSNTLMANQAGFLNYLQNGGVQGSNELTMNLLNNETALQIARESNQTAMNLAAMQSNSNMMASHMENIRSILGTQFDYGGSTAPVAIGGAVNNCTGSILGSNAQLNIMDLGSNAQTITGTINGQNVNTTIRRIGNFLSVTSI